MDPGDFNKDFLFWLSVFPYYLVHASTQLMGAFVKSQHVHSCPVKTGNSLSLSLQVQGTALDEFNGN